MSEQTNKSEQNPQPNPDKRSSMPEGDAMNIGCDPRTNTVRITIKRGEQIFNFGISAQSADEIALNLIRHAEHCRASEEAKADFTGLMSKLFPGALPEM